MTDAEFWEIYVYLLTEFESYTDALFTPIFKETGYRTIKQVAVVEDGVFKGFPNIEKSPNPLKSKFYMTDEFKDNVFNKLVENKFQQKNFNVLYKAVNEVSPISKTEFSKQAVKYKVPIYNLKKTGKAHKPINFKTINLRDGLSDETFMENLTAGVRKEYNLLGKRYETIEQLQKNINFDNIDVTVNKVQRIIDTSQTKINNLNSEIRRQQKRYKLADIDTKKIIKGKITELKSEVSILKNNQSNMINDLNNFKKGNYNNVTELKKAFNSVSKTVKNNLSKIQTEAAYKSVYRKQLSKIQSTVQTEMARARNNIELVKGKALALNKKNKVMVEIILNPTHDIIDICDDMHGVYTWEEYNKRLSPPPYHNNCGCKIRVYTIKK